MRSYSMPKFAKDIRERDKKSTARVFLDLRSRSAARIPRLTLSLPDPCSPERAGVAGVRRERWPGYSLELLTAGEGSGGWRRASVGGGAAPTSVGGGAAPARRRSPAWGGGLHGAAGFVGRRTGGGEIRRAAGAHSVPSGPAWLRVAARHVAAPGLLWAAAEMCPARGCIKD